MAVPKTQPSAQMAPSLPPPRTEVGVLGWLRKNLFSTWGNSLLTIISAWIMYVVLKGFVSWFVAESKWDVVSVNLRIFMVGGYPAEHLWRVWLVIALVSLLSGISWGAWGRFSRNSAIGVGSALLTLLILPISMASRGWIVASVGLILGGFFLGARLLSPRRRGWLVTAWVALFVVSLQLIGGSKLIGLPVVGTNLWNGLLLTLLLSVSGIVFCFPLGVLLALGRQSSLPAIRLVSIAYIELIRAVPLITILFMAQLMVPLFMPEQIRLDNVLRAFLGITLFSAAYMAENVRGGLQAVPRGQLEAAKALGLSTWQAILFIQLPQALRAVIPPIVGQFIGLLKDTSLVVIVSLTDLMSIAKSVLSQPGFLSRQYEVYLFVTLVYFILCYSLAVASRRLEKSLGVGER